MNADRVAEIKRHLAAAEGPDRDASIHMWEAARLIWEEIDSGKSRRALGQEIGKSHTHVRYMFNCWDIVGRKIGGKPEDLPQFSEVYHSTEVRGEPSEGSGDGQGNKRRREPPDHTAHGLVMSASESIDGLARNPPYWVLLTEEDWTVLRELPAVIDALIADAGHLCAYAIRAALSLESLILPLIAYRLPRIEPAYYGSLNDTSAYAA